MEGVINDLLQSHNLRMNSMLKKYQPHCELANFLALS